MPQAPREVQDPKVVPAPEASMTVYPAPVGVAKSPVTESAGGRRCGRARRPGGGAVLPRGSGPHLPIPRRRGLPADHMASHGVVIVSTQTDDEPLVSHMVERVSLALGTPGLASTWGQDRPGGP